jgi:4-hydroxybenzoyl-CoA reductase subunit beta
MLRLPHFGVARPVTLQGALALLAEHGTGARPIAGGTDLLPNLKHRLDAPELLVSLDGIDELRELCVEPDGSLVVGAMTSIERIASSSLSPPALAQAARAVASPQIRRSATLGGNVLADTRCRYYNQSWFWRSALGFCLKKDGSVCHVVPGGTKCVAASVSDTVPALMTLGAELVIAGPAGSRRLPIEELYRADGAANQRIDASELLIEVRIPPRAPGHRGAYGKLRTRAAVDFPLLGVAVRADLEPDGRVRDADLVVTALGARPLRIGSAGDELSGGDPIEGIERLARVAAKRCHPLPNVPGDPEWRQAMVPVLVRRTLRAALELG